MRPFSYIVFGCALTTSLGVLAADKAPTAPPPGAPVARQAASTFEAKPNHESRAVNRTFRHLRDSQRLLEVTEDVSTGLYEGERGTVQVLAFAELSGPAAKPIWQARADGSAFVMGDGGFSGVFAIVKHGCWRQPEHLQLLPAGGWTPLASVVLSRHPHREQRDALVWTREQLLLPPA